MSILSEWHGRSVQNNDPSTPPACAFVRLGFDAPCSMHFDVSDTGGPLAVGDAVKKRKLASVDDVMDSPRFARDPPTAWRDFASPLSSLGEVDFTPSPCRACRGKGERYETDMTNPRSLPSLKPCMVTLRAA